MKKIYALSTILVFFALFTAQGQERKQVIKQHTTKYGETVYDTVWQKLEFHRNMSISGEIVIDSSWVDERTDKLSNIESTLSPQTRKGTVFIGGQVTSGEALGVTGLKLGYFVDNNLSLGVSGQAQLAKGGAFNMSTFLRGYFGQSDKGKLFIDATINTLIMSGSSSFGFGIGTGYTVFINKNFGFDLSASYIKIGQAKGSLGLGFGFQAFIPR